LAVRLAQHGAVQVPVFAISDVIGDEPAVIGSGPCTPDPLDDATFLGLLDAHGMRSRVERVMGTVLGLEGDGHPPAVPASDHDAFSRVDYTLVASNSDAVQALAHEARARGVEQVVVLPMPLEGDATQLGDQLARMALHAATDVPGDTLLVCGGEPVVNLRETADREPLHEDEAPGDAAWSDEPLRGGRMQVLALSAALTLEQAAAARTTRAWQISVLAAGTDGRDGPTDAAGAIVDAAVPALARRAGRRPEDDLAAGRSWFALDAAAALLRPGPTGTNVMDVVALLIRA
jgi:hydroxypyruvate reductase